MKKTPIIFASLIMSLVCVASNANIENNNQKKAYPYSSYDPTARDLPLVKDLCPEVSVLKLQPNKLWVSPTGWKSNTPSFVNTINQFVGAKWSGVNFGEIVCIYAQKTKREFPVLLHRSSILVPSPTGGNWKEVSGGHKECISDNLELCAFDVQIQQDMQNIYEELDFYKGKPTEEDE